MNATIEASTLLSGKPAVIVTAKRPAKKAAKPAKAKATKPTKPAKPAKAKAKAAAAVSVIYEEPTTKQVKAWWPPIRGAAIVEMMKGGLPYWRAVKRSRRYILEGKIAMENGKFVD